jgi:hypothetical protein
VVDDLYVHRLLPQLAAMNAPDLEAVNEAWASNRAEYDRRAAELSTLVPKTVRVEVDESMLNAELLALTLDPQRQAETVRAAVDRILGAMPVPIDWFNQVREAVRPSPIDSLVLTRLGAAAIQQSQAMAQQQAEAEAERRQRQLLWDEQEFQRFAAMKRSKRMATGYLIGTSVGAVVLPVISFLFYRDPHQDPVFLWVWLLANLAAGAAAACCQCHGVASAQQGDSVYG